MKWEKVEVGRYYFAAPGIENAYLYPIRHGTALILPLKFKTKNVTRALFMLYLNFPRKWFSVTGMPDYMNLLP